MGPLRYTIKFPIFGLGLDLLGGALAGQWEALGMELPAGLLEALGTGLPVSQFGRLSLAPGGRC